jgi:cell envelope opacity-associated protein A
VFLVVDSVLTYANRELKRREKARAKEASKAAKAATQPAQSSQPKEAKSTDEELNPNVSNWTIYQD